jgi:hypothetical protein
MERDMKVLVRNTLAAIVLSPTLLIAAEAQNEVQKEAQKELHRDVKRAMAYTLPSSIQPQERSIVPM